MPYVSQINAYVMCTVQPIGYYDMYNVKSNYFFLCGFSFILWTHISRYFIWLNSFRSINFVCMCVCVCLCYEFFTQYLCEYACVQYVWCQRNCEYVLGTLCFVFTYLQTFEKLVIASKKKKKHIMLKRETNTTNWVRIEKKAWPTANWMERKGVGARARQRRKRCEKSDENVYIHKT